MLMRESHRSESEPVPIPLLTFASDLPQRTRFFVPESLVISAPFLVTGSTAKTFFFRELFAKRFLAVIALVFNPSAFSYPVRAAFTSAATVLPLGTGVIRYSLPALLTDIHDFPNIAGNICLTSKFIVERLWKVRYTERTHSRDILSRYTEKMIVLFSVCLCSHFTMEREYQIEPIGKIFVFFKAKLLARDLYTSLP